MGPIQNAMQYERVIGFIEEAKIQKWKLATGGEVAKTSKYHGKGYYVDPTVVDNPPDDSRIVLEEPFGPSNQFISSFHCG
jgi:acyl-CoA reductase-like NAD-dependent aldehyde dehydrogenase